MKSISTLVLLLFVSCLGIKAQKPILVSEDSLKFGKSLMPGLTVIIPEVNYESVVKSWIKELQSGTKSKIVTENNEMSIFGAKIKEISPDPINVYSKMMNHDSTVMMTVAFEEKKDKYIERSTGETTFTKAKNYLKEFAKDEYIDVAKDQVDAENKKLRDMKRELSSLENEKTHLQKSIESNNSDIITEKESIQVQNNVLDTLSAEIIKQNNQLSSLEAGPAQNEKMDYIKGLEKRKKKILNSIESSNNMIDKANNEIDKANLEISKNGRMQEQVTDKIAKQEAVYQKFVDKLKIIKSY